MRKKELAKEVIERLKKEYPDAGCSLEYRLVYSFALPPFRFQSR